MSERILNTNSDVNTNFILNTENIQTEDIIRFIDSINTTYNRGYSNEVIAESVAIKILEEAINFCFSDVDTAFLPTLDSINYTFNLSLNNGYFDFYELTQKSKNISSYINNSSVTFLDIFIYQM